MFMLTNTTEHTGPPSLGPHRGQARKPHITTSSWCLGWAGAHLRYFDFFCRLSVTDARIDLSSLSERTKKVFVSVNDPMDKGTSKLLDFESLWRNQGLDPA